MPFLPYHGKIDFFALRFALAVVRAFILFFKEGFLIPIFIKSLSYHLSYELFDNIVLPFDDLLAEVKMFLQRVDLLL